MESAIKVLKKEDKLFVGVLNNNSFLGLREMDVLNMPPHHMGLWNEKSLRNLCNYFPMKLDEFLYEPLQEPHKEYFQNTVYETKRKKFKENFSKYGFFGKVLNKFQNRNFEKNLGKQYPTLENYTVIAEFIKQ